MTCDRNFLNIWQNHLKDFRNYKISLKWWQIKKSFVVSIKTVPSNWGHRWKSRTLSACWFEIAISKNHISAVLCQYRIHLLLYVLWNTRTSSAFKLIWGSQKCIGCYKTQAKISWWIPYPGFNTRNLTDLTKDMDYWRAIVNAVLKTPVS